MGMGGWGVWFELTNQLLLLIHQPPLAVGFLRRFIDGAVFERHGDKSVDHPDRSGSISGFRDGVHA